MKAYCHPIRRRYYDSNEILLFLRKHHSSQFLLRQDLSLFFCRVAFPQELEVEFDRKFRFSFLLLDRMGKIVNAGGFIIQMKFSLFCFSSSLFFFVDVRPSSQTKWSIQMASSSLTLHQKQWLQVTGRIWSGHDISGCNDIAGNADAEERPSRVSGIPSALSRIFGMNSLLNRCSLCFSFSLFSHFSFVCV